MFIEKKRFFYQYDMDATTFKYGRIGGPSGQEIPGKYGVQTTGSSVTVDATDGTPFDPVNVGDLITFMPPPDTNTRRKVATKASGAQITVDSAVNLAAGTAWMFSPFRIGATATDGWHQTTAYRTVTVYIDGNTIVAAGGVDWEIQILGPDGIPLTVQSGNLAASGAQVSYTLPMVASHVRVGLKGGSGFAGTDIVNVWLEGRMGQEQS